MALPLEATSAGSYSFFYRSVCQHVAFLNCHFSWLPVFLGSSSLPPFCPSHLAHECVFCDFLPRLAPPARYINNTSAAVIPPPPGVLQVSLITPLRACERLDNSVCTPEINLSKMCLCVSADSPILSVKTPRSEHLPLRRTAIRAGAEGHGY